MLLLSLVKVTVHISAFSKVWIAYKEDDMEVIVHVLVIMHISEGVFLGERVPNGTLKAVVVKVIGVRMATQFAGE